MCAFHCAVWRNLMSPSIFCSTASGGRRGAMRVRLYIQLPINHARARARTHSYLKYKHEHIFASSPVRSINRNGCGSSCKNMHFEYSLGAVLFPCVVRHTIKCHVRRRQLGGWEGGAVGCLIQLTPCLRSACKYQLYSQLLWSAHFC